MALSTRIILPMVPRFLKIILEASVLKCLDSSIKVSITYNGYEITALKNIAVIIQKAGCLASESSVPF
jgi:galactitol-specific phosphotransferase system IIC component